MIASQPDVANRTYSDRLTTALEAGQAAGGDVRGMQSAAMLIVKKNGGVWLNQDVVLRLQVDDHPQPIQELRRLVTKSAEWRGAAWSLEREQFSPLSYRVSATNGPVGSLLEPGWVGIF